MTMTREEAITIMQLYKEELEHRIAKIDYDPGTIDLYSMHLDAFEVAIEALSAEDEGANLINRHDAVTVIREECWKCNNMINDDLFMRIMSLPTSRQTDCTEFIMWLVEVVLDDEDWELNAVSYGEVIARKLKKLGLLEVKDGYYIRPSADAEPTVIRAKTFMSKEDFDKWAEDIKRQGENIICIPCDAEVVSAEAEQGEWIKTVDGNGWNEWWVFKCPLCGATIEDKQYRSWEYNFCPNCGARMKGGDNNEID